MDKAEALQVIERAFADVRLEDGIGIFEAEALDHCVSDIKRLSARHRDERKNWHHIPDSIIEAHYAALCFMDAKGLRFHLPAYMQFSINRYATSSSAAVDSAILTLSRTRPGNASGDLPLTDEQKAAIAIFLKFMVLHADDGSTETWHASLAYEQIWGVYDPENSSNDT